MKNVFPFFRLSRELRDQIYEEVGGRDPKLKLMMPDGSECTTIDRYGRLHSPVAVVAWIIGAPRTDMLLVSGQFKEEYETELRRHVRARIFAVGTSDGQLGYGIVKQTFAAETTSTDSTAQPEYAMDGETSAVSWLHQASQLTIDLSVPLGPRHSLGLLSEEYNAIVDRLNPDMCNLRRLSLDFYLDLRNFPHEQEQLHLLQYCKAQIHDFINAHESDNERPVSIQPRFVAHNQLFCLLPGYQPTLAEKERYPSQFKWFTWEDICRFCGDLSVTTYDVGLSKTMLSDDHFQLKLLHTSSSDVGELLDGHERQLRGYFERHPQSDTGADDWTMVGSDAVNADRADSVIGQEDASEDDSDEDHFAEAMAILRI